MQEPSSVAERRQVCERRASGHRGDDGVRCRRRPLKTLCLGKAGEPLLVTLMRPVFIVGRLLASSLAAAGTVAQNLAQHLQPGSVLILGEHHHRSGSPSLVGEVVASRLEHRGCPTFGLEIASDPEQAVDAALAGEGPLFPRWRYTRSSITRA